MGFFKVDREAASKAEGGSSFINTSGIYDITLKAIIVDVNSSGARSLSLYVENEGSPQVLFSAIKLDNNDGTPNFQAPLFSKLCVVAGVDDVSDPEEATLPIGKDKAAKDVAVLPEFEDIELKMRIQMEYSVVPAADKNGKPYAKAGEISEKKIIKAFFTAEGASANEILNETEIGVNLAKDMKYADNVTYKDGLTAESVAAWVAGGRKGTATTTPTSSAPKPTFTKKFGAGK